MSAPSPHDIGCVNIWVSALDVLADHLLYSDTDTKQLLYVPGRIGTLYPLPGICCETASIEPFYYRQLYPPLSFRVGFPLTPPEVAGMNHLQRGTRFTWACILDSACEALRTKSQLHPNFRIVRSAAICACGAVEWKEQGGVEKKNRRESKIRTLCHTGFQHPSSCQARRRTLGRVQRPPTRSRPRL